VGVEGQVISL